MTQYTRREWLKFSAKMAALIGAAPSALPKIAASVEALHQGEAPVLWLQGQSCSGCSVSFLNAQSPSPVEVLTQYISLRFHSTLSTATGKLSMDVAEKIIEQGDLYLVVEGSVPAKMPHACVMGGRPIAEWIVEAASKAKAVIAVGTCSAFGGIPAAQNNPTGAVSSPDFLRSQGIDVPVIRLPGCPCHPDWLVGTLVHALSFGLPKCDGFGRPEMFYGRLLHDQCPRFSDYERENFAQKFGNEGCLFRLGCAGPNTYADCTTRYWNGGVNTCIHAGAPCVGCASELFVKVADFPIYTLNGETSSKA